MDSLKIKSFYWKEERSIPGTNWKIRGYSRSAYRTGFYIPDIKIMLDSGPPIFSNPKHIFITHTHLDHIISLPVNLICDMDTPVELSKNDSSNMCKIYGPKEAHQFIANYIKASFELNSMENNDANHNYNYIYKPMTSGDIVEFMPGIRAKVYECDHPVPTVGYGFIETRQKLKEEYLGIDKKELVAIKKSGIPITISVDVPKFAYICDTSINVFTINPELLTTYPTIFIECTFILPDELDRAIKTKHINWIQLKPYVISHPHITFILFHFSQRYKDQEIDDFFKNENLNNLSWWIMS